MRKNSKNNGTKVIILLMLLCIGFCTFLGVKVLGNSGSTGTEQAAESKTADEQDNVSEKETSTQYVLYIGTNDKETYKQEIPMDEAVRIVDGICLSYLDGYTLSKAEGRWMDESHTVTVEETIVCYIDGSDAETVYRICDEVLAALNQNTILVETNEVTMDYYAGK